MANNYEHATVAPSEIPLRLPQYLLWEMLTDEWHRTLVTAETGPDEVPPPPPYFPPDDVAGTPRLALTEEPLSPEDLAAFRELIKVHWWQMFGDLDLSDEDLQKIAQVLRAASATSVSADPSLEVELERRREDGGLEHLKKSPCSFEEGEVTAYFYSEDRGCSEVDLIFLSYLLKDLPPEMDHIVVHGCATCDKPRPDEFGGWAHILYRRQDGEVEIHSFNTWAWIDETLGELRELDGRNSG